MEDIVTSLYQKWLPHIVEAIFSYLNYNDIKSATQVSRKWRNILTNGEANVWKNLWERNMTHIREWNSLYQRAVIQRSYYPQTDPLWNPKEACRVVGAAYQKVAHNRQRGKCLEKTQLFIDEDFTCCELGTTKFVISRHSNKIYVQNRWQLEECAKSFDISHDIWDTIVHLEMSEPYIVAVMGKENLDYRVIVWDLEKEKKIYEFVPKSNIDYDYHREREGGCYNHNYASIQVKLNPSFLVTCATYSNSLKQKKLLLTVRQMPNSTYQEMDFPIVDELVFDSPENYFVESMYLEHNRIVIFEKEYLKCVIVSMKPFRISSHQEFDIDEDFRGGLTKYSNGWLMKSERYNSANTILFVNICEVPPRTYHVIVHNAARMSTEFVDFEFVDNNLAIVFRKDFNVLEFDVWNLNLQNGCEDETTLLSTFEQVCRKPNHLYLKKVCFDDTQLWIMFTLFDWFEHESAISVYDFSC